MIMTTLNARFRIRWVNRNETTVDQLVAIALAAQVSAWSGETNEEYRKSLIV